MFLTMIFTLKRRSGIPLDLFYDYWINAHAAQIACRLPGIYDLWLHELCYEKGQLWPRVPGVESHLNENERFEGVPEPVFKSEQGLNRFLENMSPLMTDEPNIFDETIAYPSIGTNTQTLVDRFAESGVPDLGVKFMLFLRAKDSTNLDAFRQFVMQDYAGKFTKLDWIKKLKVHLFEPFDEHSNAADASEVACLAPPSRRYGAMCEIVFEDGLAFGHFAHSQVWQDSLPAQSRHLSACHAFGVAKTHRLRRDGELTFEGLRTPLVAKIIERVGAVSQLSAEVEELVLSNKPCRE